ncbi:hypothetical protein [Streptomyces sp. NPDC001070]
MPVSAASRLGAARFLVRAATARYAVVGAFLFHRRAVAAGVVGVAFGAGVSSGSSSATRSRGRGATGAGLWQLTVLPVLGLAGLALVDTSAMVVPRRASAG